MITKEYIEEEIQDLLEEDELSSRELEMLSHLLNICEKWDWCCEEYDEHLSMEIANEWVANMENEDGTTGGHWSKDQTDAVLKNYSSTITPCDWYAVMNMMYSDYGSVAKKYNVNNADFYAEMAKAFIEDKDAVSGKVCSYYCNIAKN